MTRTTQTTGRFGSLRSAGTHAARPPRSRRMGLSRPYPRPMSQRSPEPWPAQLVDNAPEQPGEASVELTLVVVGAPAGELPPEHSPQRLGRAGRNTRRGIACCRAGYSRRARPASSPRLTSPNRRRREQAALGERASWHTAAAVARVAACDRGPADLDNAVEEPRSPPADRRCARLARGLRQHPPRRITFRLATTEERYRR
jgi:hypothetical protein